MMILTVMILVGVIIVLLGILFIIQVRKAKSVGSDGKIPEGQLLGRGIAIGVAIGVPIGVAMDNIALGPALGIAIGVAIGAAMEKKAREEGKIRPLTKEEKKIKDKNIRYVLILLGLGVLVLLAIFLAELYR